MGSTISVVEVVKCALNNKFLIFLHIIIIMSQEEAGANVPQEHKSAFLSFISSLGSATGDLSQLTAPAFLLNGTSLLEYSTHWADFPALLYAVNTPKSSEAERMAAVSRWFMSTLYGSYHERCAQGSEKKPYNPILGEQFHCVWHESDPVPSPPAVPLEGDLQVLNGLSGWQQAECTVEQVSHHPPVTAFHVGMGSQSKELSDWDVEINGHCGQKSKFKSFTVKVEQTGRCQLKLRLPAPVDPKLYPTSAQPTSPTVETYTLNLPELTIRGLLSGSIFLEMGGTTKIYSSTGWVTEIEYLPKPWFVGDYHFIQGRIYNALLPNNATGTAEVEYTLSGRWTERTLIKHVKTGKEEVLFDFHALPRPRKHVQPPSPQRPLESRQVWKSTTDALLKGDYGKASQEKTRVEEEQRKIRRERQERGQEWRADYFEFEQDQSVALPQFQPTSPVVSGSVATEKKTSKWSLKASSSSMSGQTQAMRGSSMTWADLLGPLVDVGHWKFLGTKKK